MSVEENKALAQRFYDELATKGKLELIDEIFAEDFVEHEAFPGLSEGREGVRQFFSMMRTAFDEFRMDVEDIIAEGDKVVAHITMTGTHSGEFMDIAGTGATINVHAIDILRFANGKAVEHWGVTDGLSMMEQLGALNRG
jgi:steroid delta-isomerase-like uncharacterized protein